jgi:hypothetical protein
MTEVIPSAAMAITRDSIFACSLSGVAGVRGSSSPQTFFFYDVVNVILEDKFYNVIIDTSFIIHSI